MFGKIEYKLLIENYMTKEEYKQLIEDYMNKYGMSYTNAKQLIMQQQIKKFEKDFGTSYEKAFIQKYNDMNYNISSV
jgi:Glu-tRNA(Gln) amidotransferase subunit E-like FAD-binding protein